jgi:TFIIF-interacting CTD phosphatase-like protein
MLQNVILDIDNTLLHAISHSPFAEFCAKHWSKKHQTIVKSDFHVFFLRPYLKEFLQFLFDNFQVGIFTAGNEPYAYGVVIDVIKPLLRSDQRNLLQFVFHKTHFDECQAQYGTTKDLKYVHSKIPHFVPEETIIIDDLDQVFESNIDNCIPCPAFFVTPKQEEKNKFYREAVYDSFLSTVQVYLQDCKRPFLETLRDSPLNMWNVVDSEGEIF